MDWLAGRHYILEFCKENVCSWLATDNSHWSTFAERLFRCSECRIVQFNALILVFINSTLWFNVADHCLDQFGAAVQVPIVLQSSAVNWGHRHIDWHRSVRFHKCSRNVPSVFCSDRAGGGSTSIKGITSRDTVTFSSIIFAYQFFLSFSSLSFCLSFFPIILLPVILRHFSSFLSL